MFKNKTYYAILGLFCLIALSVVLNRVLRKVPQTPVQIVTIQEGLTAVEISELLKKEGVFVHNEIFPQEFEGYLFPDTYEFYVPSSLEFVVKKISSNFESKVAPILPSVGNGREIMTVASLVEGEVRDPLDRRLVAGIIWKRLRNGMLLQIDSSICYIKSRPCHPVSKDDLSLDSPYNTYLYKGLPPGPVSNPGLDAVIASMKPENSRYWFYLSDPRTKKTIFATTLDEHNENVARYLREII